MTNLELLGPDSVLHMVLDQVICQYNLFFTDQQNFTSDLMNLFFKAILEVVDRVRIIAVR